MNGIKSCIIYFMIFLTTITIVHAQKIAVPDGYADYAGTTGGGNATPVVVTTAEELRSLTNDDTPGVIVVQGRLDLGSSLSIGSNKTIVGADTSSGFYGGTINVKGHNCIFQNLT